MRVGMNQEPRLVGRVISCNPAFARGPDGKDYFIPASQFVGLAIGDRVTFAALGGRRPDRAVNIVREPIRDTKQ
jgi:hypothetical protein